MVPDRRVGRKKRPDLRPALSKRRKAYLLPNRISTPTPILKLSWNGIPSLPAPKKRVRSYSICAIRIAKCFETVRSTPPPPPHANLFSESLHPPPPQLENPKCAPPKSAFTYGVIM